VNPRRSRPVPIHIPEPLERRAFGSMLRQSLATARDRAREDIGGFDERRLMKIKLDRRLDPDALRSLSRDIEIVSQEDDTAVLIFVTEEALAQFERRLTTLIEGGLPTYRNIVYALQAFDKWTDEDRTGWALRNEGWPASDLFSLDVELWPVGSHAERELLYQQFEGWLREQGIQNLDAVKQSVLVLYRVKARRDQGEALLRNRDVRMVDLPPHWGIDFRLLRLDISNISRIPEPPDQAPGVVVLDSGIVQNHPLLAPAIGDAQSFIPGLAAEDEHGHGTLVAGIALYGDILSHAEMGNFIPSLHLYSGRVLDASNQADDRLIENAVEEAVRYFYREYGCKIFNLSYGDLRKPYRGGRVRGLAVTLDTLSRELGLLFVVPTGNFEGENGMPGNWRTAYPGYLLQEQALLLDPAPALNVLTVGGIARWDATFNSKRYQHDPAEQPIARRNQPSPFTRRGPSVNGAIKPEFVAYAGNWAVNERTANSWIIKQGLGELSTSIDFASGPLLGECAGTSFAAPLVAHYAARILAEHPEASASLLRALLVVHAQWSEAEYDLLPNKDERLHLCGYGSIIPDALLRSDEQEVTLIAEELIPDHSHHFYELPVPEEFWEGGRRTREIVVGLAHTPAVRTTRVAYKSCRINFRLVSTPDLNVVTNMFNAATSPEDYERIPEVTGAAIGANRRSPGTLQVDRWLFRQPSTNRREQRMFLVVTRADHPWARDITLTAEPYALSVVIRDHENAAARLYTQIQTRLVARVRARVRP
jgi:hypothetical protein